ncbi:unnamed protein product, partial [Ilex paraguariensis]
MDVIVGIPGKSPSSSKFRERGCNSYKCGDWFSSEDEDWRAGGDDIPNVRHECQYICHVEENSDDGFSNYESGDEGVATSTDTNIDVDEESRVNREKKKKSTMHDTFEYGSEFHVGDGGNT